MHLPRTSLPRSRAALTSLCLLTWVGLLVAGWWPFNFFPRNRVKWLRDGDGIHFDRYGQVFSPPPPSPQKYRGPLSIEIWLRSSQRTFDYGEIVTFGGDRGKALVIAQSGPDMVVEGFFSDHGSSFKARRFFLPQALADSSTRFLTITASHEQTLVYLDSKLQRSLPPLRIDDIFNGLLIGHSPNLNDPWSGDLLGLGVYRRFLDRFDVTRHRDFWLAGNSAVLASEDAALLYSLDEGRGAVIHNRAAIGPDLVIPRRFYRQGGILLEHSLPLNRPQLKDILVNITGLIPFGFVLALWARSVMHLRRPKCVLFAIMGGAITSLLIEVLQIFLPTRDSSLIDVIGNSFGSSCGALAWFALSVLLTKPAANKKPFPEPPIGAFAVERRKSLG